MRLRRLRTSGWREKRHELVIERFRRKLGNKCVFMTFAAWQSFIARVKWERVTLARFAKKMSQRRELASFMSWIGFVGETKRVKALLTRICKRLDNSLLLKGFLPLEHHAYCTSEETEELERARAEERRRELIIERFRRKLGNKCIFMCFAAWQSFLARMKWERVTLARFAKKIKQRKAVSSFASWREFIGDRKYVKALLLRIFGRLDNSTLNKAFMPWCDAVAASKAQDDALAALENERAAREQRHELVVKRFRAKMHNKGLFMCYAGWQSFIARIKWERVTLGRFAKKMSQRREVSSFASWRDFISDRKYVKALLLRIFGRLDNSTLNKAFMPWVEFVQAAKDLEEEMAQAQQLMNRHEVCIQRLRHKIDNRCVTVTLAAWITFIARLKWERVTLKRFFFKRSKRTSVRVFQGWLFFVRDSARIKELLTRIFRGIEIRALGHGLLMKMAHASAQKAIDVHDTRRRDAAAAEKQKHHELVVGRFRRKLQNKGVFMTLAAWQAFVKRLKWERLVVARFAKKISQRSVVSSLASWRDFVGERKHVKALLLRASWSARQQHVEQSVHALVRCGRRVEGAGRCACGA